MASKGLFLTKTIPKGVKLVTDYCQIITKDPEDLDNLLQVVEAHRKKYPDTKKSTLKKQ